MPLSASIRSADLPKADLLTIHAFPLPCTMDVPPGIAMPRISGPEPSFPSPNIAGVPDGVRRQ